MTTSQPVGTQPPAADSRSECVCNLDCDPIPSISAAAMIAAAALVVVPFFAGLALGAWLVNAPEAVHAAR